MIGSVRWRLENYGFKPALHYLLGKFDNRPPKKSHAKEIALEHYLEITSESFLDTPINWVREYVSNLMEELRTSFQQECNPPVEIKSDWDAETSLSRLLVIISLLETHEVDTFIETGTQHGISASAVAGYQLARQKFFPVYSIDVQPSFLVRRESNVNYIVLSKPVRKNFKKITLELGNSQILFFHDSDHSFENMMFEFDWAWNVLKVEILIAVDIDMNSAFSKFCRLNSIREQRLKVDFGTTIGVIVRNSKDENQCL